MELSEHLYNTLFASFRSNVVPPRIKAQKRCPQGPVLSIGSLVLYPKRLSPSTEDAVSGSTTDVGPRCRPESLRVTLSDSKKGVAETVIVSLNGNRFRQAEVFRGSTGPQNSFEGTKRVKHRYTYRRKYLDGEICDRAAESSTDTPINNRKHVAKIANHRISLSCRTRQFSKCLKRHKNANDSFLQEYVRNCQGGINCTRCAIFTRKRPKIRNPRIINLGIVVKLNMEEPMDSLLLRCELDLGDALLTSEHVMRKNTSTFIPFYDSQNLESEEHPDGNECCCTFKESLVCSLHFKRILDEMQAILGCLYARRSNAIKYRYMLYHHLQALHFLQSRGLKHCNIHRIPEALLSVSFGHSRGCGGIVNGMDEEDFWGAVEMRLHRKRFIRHVVFLHCNVRNGICDDLHDCHNDPSGSSNEAPPGPYSETHVLSIPHGLQCIYHPNDPLVVLDSTIFCNKIFDMMVRSTNVLSLKPGNISFMIEPEDFTFLRLLVNTPLYNVRFIDEMGSYKATMGGNKTIMSSHKTIHGSISYEIINGLMWRYKHVLARYSNTLSTFLRFVDYSDASQVESLKTLLKGWKRQNVESLMELISCDFLIPYVRMYIMESISVTFTLENVKTYINQLVLSLLYDIEDCLLNFLFSVSASSFELSMDLYWYISCNFERNISANERRIFGSSLTKYLEFLETASLFETINAIDMQKRFVSLLKCADPIEWKITPFGAKNKPPETHNRPPETHSCEEGSGGQTVFEQRGNELEAKSGFPLFTHPNLVLKTLVLSKCRILKSKRYPMVLHSRVSPRMSFMDHPVNDHSMDHLKDITFMYKSGDDLRQDQLCQQLIGIINMRLKGHGIRTGLIPYKIMPISPSDGFIEFIPNSSTIFDIVRDWGSLKAFLESRNGGNGRHLRNFVDSLASLSVISYIFGIRDRHYHNILMTRDGFLVHVDFSYIFGADPTPLLQPPFKLSREFMDLLGGRSSHLYKKFAKKFTCIFYILRSHSTEILNLLYASLSSQLPNLSLKAVVEVEMRFKLDLKRDSIETFAQGIICESANSYSPLILDTWHKISNFFK